MPAPDHERQLMSDKPPTAKQLAYLRALAERTGRTFASPCTSRDAGVEIRKLKAAPVDSHLPKRRIEQATSPMIAAGPQDGAKVEEYEVTGGGSNATWSQRS